MPLNTAQRPRSANGSPTPRGKAVTPATKSGGFVSLRDTADAVSGAVLSLISLLFLLRSALLFKRLLWLLFFRLLLIHALTHKNPCVKRPTWT